MEMFAQYRFKKCRLRWILLAVALASCTKLVEVPPPSNSLTSDNVYTNDGTAAAVLTGIYTTIASQAPASGGSINSISLITGLSADELTLFGGAANTNSVLVQYYLDRLNAGLASAPQNGNVWYELYLRIYTVNIALQHLPNANGLTPAVRQDLIGEAKFLRAFFYFYLVNLYGDVPLTTSSDPSVNAVLSRSSKALVYQQIIADLTAAQGLLPDGYVAGDAKTSTSDRVRPNKWAATALLARVYLYNNDWSDAIKQATAVISYTTQYSLTPLNDVFLKNSNEAIWQLQPVNLGWNTEDARLFVLPSAGPSVLNYPVYLTQGLLNSFEQGDERLTNWINQVTVNGTTYFYPFKYKSATLNTPVTEYTMMMRLGEQYLIRAEAEAENNDSGDAITDLNTIRSRAGLSAYAGATDQTSLLAAILHERQVELFTEWGHRWLDIKRTGNVNTVMTAEAPAKGTTWNPDWALYPLPLYDITQDPKLIQSPGY